MRLSTFLYLGDTAGFPYGSRSAGELREFSLEIAGELLRRGAKLIVVACNSATAAALQLLAPPVAARLVSRMRAPAVEAPTARELQVLSGVARGLTNAEIGRELFIGEATVKTHLLRVFAKLGVDERTRAVMVAVERGLLPGAGSS